MELTGKRIGFALTGSFCTYKQIMPVITELVALGADVMPILSYNAANFDTRFMKAAELKHFLTTETGHEIVDDIVGAEPIGPQKLLDLLIIAPCTGNTLAKLALGVTDTPVLLAAKAHLRKRAAGTDCGVHQRRAGRQRQKPRAAAQYAPYLFCAVPPGQLRRKKHVDGRRYGADFGGGKRRA